MKPPPKIRNLRLRGAVLVAGLILPAVCLAQTPQRKPVLMRTERAYPTGDRTTSIVAIEHLAPTEVRRGERFVYELRLTNLTRADLSELVLVEQIPAALTVQGIQPQPTRLDGNRAVWQIGALQAGASLAFRVSAATTQMEELSYCATVTFAATACASTRVVEPLLALTKQMPADVILCDEIPIRLTVGNRGSGVARGVRITDTLPNGLLTLDGKNAFLVDVGDLGAGQSREFTVPVRAAARGEFCNTAQAAEEGGQTVQATACTRVHKPELAVTKRGPELRYLGRPATFEITVANTGDAPARDAVLVDTIPAGVAFVSADNDGQFAAGRVQWSLGTLEPGASRSVRVVVNPTQRGVVENSAVARAYCAEGAASARMEIRGVPAILLEVVDVEDPIEVGQTITYRITVTNQGSADGTNIRLDCTLPPELDYVSAEGPVAGQAAGKLVTFAPLARLAPKATASYTVQAKGTAIGDLRFKVVMSSDQMSGEPVEETESTHVY